MKVNKYISIDEDIFKKLSRETNASDLINQQLIAYYNQKSCKNIEFLKQKYAEIKQIIKENRKKEKELRQEIAEIDQKNKDFFNMFTTNYPKSFIERLKKIENLDYEAALNLSKEFDLHKRGIGGVKIIKIWEELKKENVIRKQ